MTATISLDPLWCPWQGLQVTAAFIFGCLLLSAWLLEGEQRPHQRVFGKEESGQHIFCALCENKLLLRWIKHKKDLKTGMSKIRFQKITSLNLVWN